MKTLFGILFVLIALQTVAQVDSMFYNREQQLKLYLDKLRSVKTDLEREEANKVFKSYLYETIQQKGAFDYAFSNLKSMGSIKSPDNTFRLFNWNIELEDRTNKYYCYVLRLDEKKKEWKVIELVDNSLMLPARPDDILNEENWYGALYYKIIPVEKSNKTLYTVLGLDANNATSNIKMIDVISFSGNHVKLGSPIFKMNDGLHKRLFFEYSKKAFMSLNYDETRKRIIYDHLSPETPSMEGFYEYYVPDLSYDELKFYGNKWHLNENVIGVNEQNTTPLNANALTNKKNSKGEIRTERVKNKWIDPSDPSAPGSANVHVAKLPDEDLKAKPASGESPENLEPKISKRKKRKNEFSMNPYIKGKNNK